MMSHKRSTMDSSLPRPPSMFLAHPFFGLPHPMPLPSIHQGFFEKQRASSRLSSLAISSSMEGARLPSVPLRQRHLPASFWQEPNRPRDEHGGPGGEFGGSGLAAQLLSQGATYRDFLARLTAAEVRHDPLSTRVRFPITEFLYYNYGLKQRLGVEDRGRGLEGGGRRAREGGPDFGALCSPRHDISVWPHHRMDASKTSDNAPSSTSSSLFPSPSSAVCLHPGCPCLYASLASGTAGKVDCWRLGSGLTSSKSGSEDVTASPWKPLAPKSLTTYPLRFHPFAYDR